MLMPATAKSSRPTIEHLDINSLRKCEYNPRRITEPQFNALKKSLLDDPHFFDTRPCLVNRRPNGELVIYGGNMRYEAAKSLGWASVPAVVVEIPLELEKERNLKDNNPYGEYVEEQLAELFHGLSEAGKDIYSMGFSKRQAKLLIDEGLLQRPIHGDPPITMDESLPVVTQIGDIFHLGLHTLMCGNSTNRDHVDALMQGNRYKSVITSPPYFLERNSELGITPSDISSESARELITMVASVWWDYCIDGGYFVDNFAGIQSFDLAKKWTGIDHCEYPASLLHWEAFRSANWRLHAERIWVKPHSKCTGLWVLSTNRPVFSWEYIWTWRKGIGQEILGDSDLRARGWWDSSKEEDHKLRELGHDASFPLAVPLWSMRVHTQHGDIVADPFAGTGTTLIACEMMERPCYSMEINPRFCDVIRDRYARTVGDYSLAAHPEIMDVNA